VIRAGAANQRAVDIEENKRSSQFSVYGPRMVGSEPGNISRWSHSDGMRG
jgi:hypothetical protein